MAAVRVDFVDDGLLWLINAAALHPRGFALEMVKDQPGSFMLRYEGPEPITFPDSPALHERFRAFERIAGNLKKLVDG